MTLAQSSICIGPAGGVLGFDMGVVLQLAQAFGYDAASVADLIGVAQPILVEKFNKK
jgi:hypothetical protein